MTATTPSAQGRGRPKEDPLKIARRWVLRYRQELEEVEEEFESILGLTPDDELGARGPEVRALADQRIKKAKVYDKAKTRTGDARKLLSDLEGRENPPVGQIKAARKALDECKEAEREALAELNALPDLGYTRDEWESTPQDMRPQQELGRPRLPIEVKLVRAQDNLRHWIGEMHSIERKRGLEATDPYDIKESDEDERQIGRPRLDDIGSLDRELKRAEARLQEIETEKPRPLSARRKSASGKPLGRKGLSKKEKIRRQKERIFGLRKAIWRKEYSLDDDRLFKRMRKRLLDEARVLRQSMRERGIAENGQSTQARQLADLNDRIERFSFFDTLQLHIRELKEAEMELREMADNGSREAKIELRHMRKAIEHRQDQLRQLTGAAIEGIDLAEIQDSALIEAAASAEALVESVLSGVESPENLEEGVLAAKLREIDEAFERISEQRTRFEKKMGEHEQALKQARARLSAEMSGASTAVN